ncbi:MAG TPA: M1 family aminopeptidase/hydrolase [Thermoanaerobaculia bacterium]|nr:M1 family aminopeptidase/hydrolase [Thermoanaerobaculia bacterium]
MPLSRRLALLVFSFTLIAARQRAVVHPTTPPLVAPEDVVSFAEPEKVTTRHLALDLTVDFDRKELSGSATLDIENLSSTNKLVLDTRDMTIHSVTVDGVTAHYTLGSTNVYGAPLTIDVTPASRVVKIDYTSHNTPYQNGGLYWNTAAQSYGRKFPYLYSQNEPDDARNWIPIQDTPSVRMTYDATIHVPQGFLALMSAENPTQTNDTGVYTFHQGNTVPAYLIALAAAHLEFRATGPRTGVYAEPELIDDAAWDLQWMPEMVDAAERIAGPYRWGRYDVLLMPPTYVVGGMEHPRLNFISPFGVVNGNHAEHPLPSPLIAHELAHAWSGDLVTTATWEDIWLNEGITSYLTYRIIEELSGPDRVQYYQYSDNRSFASFAAAAVDPRATLLHRPLVPYELAEYGFNSAAYTKGALFGVTLEKSIGRESFDAFLKDYFSTFAFRWMDSATFLSYLRQRALAGRSDVEAQLQLDRWVYQSGLPENVGAPAHSALYDRVSAEATRFRSGTKIAQLNTTNWTDVEIDLFLSLTSQALLTRMSEVDAFWHLSERKTPPLNWMVASARSGYQPGLAGVERVLLRGGSNSQVLTLYYALMDSTAGKNLAKSSFLQAHDRYDESVAAQVQSLLDQAGLLSDEDEALAA